MSKRNDSIIRAVDLIKRGRREKARRVIKRELARSPDNARAFMVLAELAGNERAALRYLREAERLEPGNPTVQHKLAQLEQKHGPAGRIKLLPSMVENQRGKQHAAHEEGDEYHRIEQTPAGRALIFGGMVLIILTACAALSAAGVLTLPAMFAMFEEPVVSGPDEVDLYLSAVNAQIDSTANALFRLEKQLSTIAEYPVILNDSAWVADLNATLSAIVTADQSVRDLTPPDELWAVHVSITDATSDCSTGATRLADGLDKRSAAYVTQAHGLLDSCASKLDQSRYLIANS